MAWTNPGTAVAGDVLTAAFWNAQVRDNMLMGNPVFTNEAARDAAIPSPSEGQRAYLTAPTVPTAAGAVTMIPSGVQTIYNGSAWVCVTPVGAFTGASGNTTSTSFTATLTGTPGTNPSVTLVTGTVAIISIAVYIGTAGFQYHRMSVAVSGASTIAANDDWSIFFRPYNPNPEYVQPAFGATHFITGLTAGTNTFTLQYKVDGGVSSAFGQRRIIAQGVA